MREQLPLEEEEVKKAIKEAAESLPDEEVPEEETPEGAVDVSEEEAKKALDAVQKRMDEENPER